MEIRRTGRVLNLLMLVAAENHFVPDYGVAA